MNAIELIKEKLQKNPHIKYEEGSKSIRILPATQDGFSVSLHLDSNGITIYYDDGWHETFQKEDEALDCFSFGLSENCRLKVTTRGNFRHQWQVQALVSGSWETDSETGLLLFPFWKKPNVNFFQNKFIKF